MKNSCQCITFSQGIRCFCIQWWLQPLSDFPDVTSQPVCVHSCLFLSSENKNPFLLNVLRFGCCGQNYERFPLKSWFPMQQDRKNTARQSIWASELCRYLEVQSIRSSDLQVWLKSCSRQHDIAPSHFKCDELLIDVLKRELELASQNSPQEYRLCLQLGCLGVILAHFDKSLSPVVFVSLFPPPQSCHFNWCLTGC